MQFEPAKIRNILNEFNEPVLLMDWKGICVVANTAALKTLEKAVDLIEGHLGGDIICRVHSKEPGGCGNTIHCSGCAIRNTVIDAFETGKNHLKVEAYHYTNRKKNKKNKIYYFHREARE